MTGVDAELAVLLLYKNALLEAKTRQDNIAKKVIELCITECEIFKVREPIS